MKEEYKTYLNSQEWQHVRQDAFKLHGDGCLVCGSFARVQLHHIYYPRDICATEAEHVIPLCERCHRGAHCLSEKPYTWDYSKLEETKQRVLSNLRGRLGADTFYSRPGDLARLELLKKREREHPYIVAMNRYRVPKNKPVPKAPRPIYKAPLPRPEKEPCETKPVKIKKKAKLKAIELVLEQVRANPNATHYVFDIPKME